MKTISGCLKDFDQFMEDERPAWVWFQELFGELPPPDKVKKFTVHFTWFHERFRMLPVDASEDTVCIYACDPLSCWGKECKSGTYSVVTICGEA
ncbi:hypothetical protein AHAS_Ahas03G0223000 [Arachis hypogaea]